MKNKQEPTMDDALNDLDRVNIRLTFLREVPNLEYDSDFNVNDMENYGYGKSLIIEDIQNELNRIIENIQSINKKGNINE